MISPNHSHPLLKHVHTIFSQATRTIHRTSDNNTPRIHNGVLPNRLSHLTDCNIIIRMLFYQAH